MLHGAIVWLVALPLVIAFAALGALTALLIGLMGATIGGWMASGEPMTLAFDRIKGPAAVRRHAQRSIKPMILILLWLLGLPLGLIIRLFLLGVGH